MNVSSVLGKNEEDSAQLLRVIFHFSLLGIVRESHQTIYRIKEESHPDTVDMGDTLPTLMVATGVGMDPQEL